MYVSGDIAYGFMGYFVDSCADHSPDRVRRVLPVGVTKKEIFKIYKQRTTPVEQIKRSQFYNIWSKKMKHVSYPKVSHEMIQVPVIDIQK